MIKTRFAPSPTGLLHVGGLRTALYAYLFAKSQRGDFLLRIEDTDRERFVEGGMENILHSLYWAGIVPDEGVCLDEKREHIIQKGTNGPYVQSERLPIYQKYLQKLLEDGSAYHCFCTKERLENIRTVQEENKIATGYDGYCKTLTVDEIQAKIDAGVKSVVRMNMPDTGVTEFTDMVRGKVSFENNLIDDQVLMKSDGFPTYHFAVVVDDYLMGITHVIRAEEWLPSTPKHIMLYQMFGWKAPEYAHLSLLVNEKKQKLSKRHGDVSVQDFKEKGYLPEAFVNFISFLGWNPGDEREIFSLKELENEFDFKRVGKPAAFFNIEKLNWYNSQYIKKMENEELVRAAIPYFINAGLASESDLEPEWMEKVVGLAKDRLDKLSDLPEMLGFVFAKNLEYEADLLVWKKSTHAETKERLRALAKFLDSFDLKKWNKAELESKVTEWINQNKFTVGEVLWPMRVALSGKKNSPGPFEIAEVLGSVKVRDRLLDAESKFKF